MNTIQRTASFVALCGLAVLASSDAFSQALTDPNIKPYDRVIAVEQQAEALRQAAIKKANRPALNFSPLRMVQPGTDKIIAPNTIISLPNGRRMTAQVYYTQLNALEQQMNRAGDTLRFNNSELLDLATPDRPELVTQYNRITADIASRANVDVNYVLVQTPSVSFNRTWGDTIGNDKFGMEWGGYLNLKATSNDAMPLQRKTNITGSFEQRFGLRALNTYHQVFRGTAGLDAQVKINANYANASAAIYVMGQQWWTDSKSIGANSSISFAPSFRFPDFVSGSFRVWAGPIPLSVKLGVSGEVKLDGTLFMSPQPGLTLRPSGKASAFADVGVDVYVAAFGFGANLTLLDGGIDITAKGGLDTITKAGQVPRTVLSGEARVDASLKALSGNVNVWARLGWGWLSHTWRTDVFSWSGYNWNYNLVNDKATFPLSW